MINMVASRPPGKVTAATHARTDLVVRYRRLHALAVEWCDTERLDVDAVEAADVDCHHVAAVGSLALRERSHTAITTERMMEDFLVELVVGEIVAARAQRKTGGRNECPQ